MMFLIRRYKRSIISARTGRSTRMAVIERLGGCCHGRSGSSGKKVKSRIRTVTEVLPDAADHVKWYGPKSKKGEYWIYVYYRRFV